MGGLPKQIAKVKVAIPLKFDRLLTLEPKPCVRRCIGEVGWVGTMNAEQHQALMSGIAAALASTRITAWQRNFLTDMQAKFARYGTRTRLSDKQQKVLHDILGRLLPEPGSHAATSQRACRSVTPIRYPRRRRKPLAREAQWMVRRFLRTFAFAAALFAVIFGVGLIEPLFDSGRPASVGTGSSTVAAYVLNQPRIEVIDGDTIRVAGQSRNVRLVGFNTPETGSAQCSQERALGHQASARLKQLVANGTPSIKIVPCACKPGTHGTRACNFGRACGILKVDGYDVGETLIAERLAVRFRCGGTSCPPMPRPWC